VLQRRTYLLLATSLHACHLMLPPAPAPFPLPCGTQELEETYCKPPRLEGGTKVPTNCEVRAATPLATAQTKIAAITHLKASASSCVGMAA
jgi:hypothetical protein